ncbi:MAG: glycosyltransferase family 39 protein [Zavarzinella sp.]|nr:glycosyltransferase family 39 protein [Zavarzinella sp.]
MTPDSPDPGQRSLPLRWLAVGIILAVTAFRVFYLLRLCPYDLSPDEAHYWDWSRHLDWSYYSKGPLVAWIIRAGCELFGGVSLAADGSLMPAVRIPAVLFGAGLLAGLYVLTYQTFRSDRLSFWVVVGAISLPAFTACSLVMTIDAPFLCFWTWALVFGRWALVDNRSWAWPAAGLLVALGILAKYTMALWLVSAGLFVLFTPGFRRHLVRPGFWVMALVAGLSAVPILYWNSQNDWVTFRHVAVQAGVVESRKASGVRWFGPFEYVAGQFLVLLGFWFVAWAAALVRYRPRPTVPIGHQYLWWMSVPTFVVFLASSVRASGQLNWPVAAYLSGAVLTAGWLAEGVALGRRGLRWALGIALGLGFFGTVLLHDTRIITLPAGSFASPETTENPTPIRGFDPAARLKGYRYVGQALDAIRAEVADAESADPVLAGLRWDVPGLLAFYTEGHPQAYTFGLALGIDRHSQYDLWHPNPVNDAQAFRGRTFLVVGGGDLRAVLGRAFDTVGPPQEVVYREHGRALAKWYVCVCRGYRGVTPARRPGAEAEH